MRIIAGYLGGRNIFPPAGHRTHPMSEKMRGAIFGSLGNVEDLLVLDAYAGSGAIAIEAISRGAKFAYAIDNDKKAVECINKNIAVLGIENNLKVTRANITSWIGNNKDKRFDIVVADPPYDKLNIEALQKASSLLAADGLLVLSWPGGVVAPELKLMRQIKSKSYGDSSLHYYKRII